MIGICIRKFRGALVWRQSGRQLTQAVLTACLCVSTFAQEWKTVANGVEHAHVRREFKGKPVNFNLLRLDLKKVRLDVHHAMDAAIGTEKTSSLATRHGAFAAINAGFFRLDKSLWAGDAAEGLMIDGELFSESNHERISLLIENSKSSTEVFIGTVKLVSEVAVGEVRNADWEKPDGINRERRQKEMVLYTPMFGKTTLTQEVGTEIILDKCKKGYLKEQYEKSFYRTCKTVEIKHGVKNSAIPRKGFVLSISFGKFAKGDSLIGKLTALSSRQNMSQGFNIIYGLSSRSNVIAASELYDVVAGVPKLIEDGKIDITWEEEKSSKAFVETRHPRTAVAKLKDGKFLMLTADGRSGESAGLDLYDLAAYMLELGATDAMNLDGGGSTTMFLKGKVVNKPSDKEGERKVGDAILVTLRKR